MNYAGKFDAALILDGQGSRSPADGHVDSFTAKAHGHVPDGAVVIADPNLIFHGEFKRTGLDLVLSRDGHDFVVHDYFRGDKRAAIASPDGAHLTGDIVSALTGYVQVAQAAPGAAAAQAIGHVTKLTGSATAIRNGVSVILNNGDNVEKGDVVSTGSDSTLGITFIDGTVFGLSSNARMVLNEMVYDPNGSNNSSLLSLVAGTITFVAGETAKHGDMKVDTPVATMGIRGTAVLTEINFVVPAGGGDPQPQANFQVLVEPNGTTGSYILFDKLTLLPIATVNQAGQMIQISGGNVSVTNALLSPDVQKLITDVFTLKFTDNNTNTKLTQNFTDTITQDGNIVLIKAPSGATATGTFTSTVNGSAGGPVQGGGDKGIDRIPGPPFATSLDANGNVTSSFSLTEHAKATGDRLDATGDPVGPDILPFKINFVDLNLGDRPTVSVAVAASDYTYTDAGHHDITRSLSALQKRDIAATQVQISVAADAGNNNNGSATLTYTVPDHAFDFLADGETLTLTYIVSVDNNFAVNPETTRIPITITVTGTNDKPVITTSVPTIVFSGGTSVPGGPLTTNVPTSGTLTFTDVDLTDTHTVSVALTGASLPDGSAVPPGPLAAFQNAMSVAIANGFDSTGTGTGTINWSLADLPVYLADFIPKGEVLTLVYTVTVADEHDAISQQTITVTITGTDAPAVVWIATNQPSGGFWNDAANWETRTVPTSSDDVIVITDQLHGLTPSYPVTIDVAAYGRSLTMDDYDTTVHHTAPQLINHGTLALGGMLTLNADAQFTNAADGTVVVGGPIDVETITRPQTGVVVTNTAAITNAGTLTLDAGGVIDTLTTIVNSGAFNLFGGTLTLDTGIANAGGTLHVGSFATLVANAVTIDGGTVNVSGTLELDGMSLIENGALGNSGAVNAMGAVEFANETVSNSGLIEVFAHDALTIDQGSRVNNSGNVKVDAGSKLTVNGATIDGGAIVIIPGTPVLVYGASDTAGATFTFTMSSPAGTLTNNGELDLTGNAVLSDGNLTNNGTLDVTGTGNELIGEAVTNAGTIEVLTGALAIGPGSAVANSSGNIIVDAALTLNAATISGGPIEGGGSIDVTGASTIDSGATLSTSAVTADAKLIVDGITVSGSVITDNSSIELDDTVKLQGGATIQGGPVTNNGTVEIAGAATLLNDIVTNNGTVQVDGNQTLNLSGGKISGGMINGSGTIDVTGASTIDGGATLSTSAVTVEAGTTLTLDTATVDGATISDKGSVTIDGTVKLTGGAVIKGDSSVFAPKGGSPATVEFNWGQLGASYTVLDSPQQVVATDGTGGTVSSAGGLLMRLDQSSGWWGNFAPGTHLLWDVQSGPDITVKFATPVSSAGAQIQADYYGSFTAEIIAYDLVGNVIGTVTEDGVSNGNSDGSAIFIDLISNSADIAMVKFMLTSATYSPNDFAIGPVQFSEEPSVGGSGPIVNNGTLEIEGPATLLDDIVTNHGTVTVDPGQTLTLSGSEISGGSIAGTGTIDVTGASAIDGGATLSTGFVTVETHQALMLDKMTVDGTTITDKGSIELDDTVKLQGGAQIQGGPVTNNGTLEIAGAATLLNDIVTNNGTVQVDGSQTLKLSGSKISGGIVNGSGTIDVTGASTIDSGATLSTSAVTAGAKLTLDGVTVSGSVITDNASIELDDTVKLQGGATIQGGPVTNNGTLEIAGAATLLNDIVTNIGTVQVDGSQTLKLSGTEISGGTVNGSGTIDVTGASTIDGGATLSTSAVIADAKLTLDGVTVSGSVITDNSSIELDDTVKLQGGTQVQGGPVTNNGTLEIAGAATLLNDIVTNSGAVQVDDGQILTLSGTEISGGTINIYSGLSGGTIAVTGDSTFDGNATLNNGAVTVASDVTLKFDDATVSASKIINSGTVKVETDKQLTLAGATLTGGALTIIGTLTSSGTTTVTDANISNSYLLESTLGGLLSLVATSPTPVISNTGGTIRANNAELDIISEAVTNTGTLAAINDGTLKLISTDVTNTGGAVSIEAGSTFDLSGATVDGGTLTIAGTLVSTGTSTISNADITNTGTMSVTGGTLTIDPVVVHTLTNHQLIQANGGELDVSGEQIVNTADIKAINGILRLSGLGVTNDGGTITVDGASTLYLAAVSINGGSLNNSGNLYGVSGLNTISAAITNTGTIETQAGTLNLSGGLSGAGSLVIDDGATLELAGATAQTVTFAGGADTLQLDKVVGQSFTGTITGQSATGGTFTVAGAGDITTSSGDALDFTASGGTSLKPAYIVLTPSGVLNGAANGIVVTQNGTGDISLTATKNITGLAGNGITLRDSATGFGNITINNLTGSATGTGANSEGILVENLNDANAGNISITQLGGATGGAFGIDATTLGNGDVTIDGGGNITGGSVYGIRARSYGTGSETVTTEAGSVVTSASSGIVAVNRAISLDASDDSTITINAYGTINSGSSLNQSGGAPAGIQVGYNGGVTGAVANTGVNGTVVVNNHANITAAAGSGIEAHNWGNGDVTVTSFAGTTISTSGTQSYGIDASALSGGTGDIMVTLGTSVTISGATAYGIKAYSIDAGDITVTLATGDSITSDSSGIVAMNDATAIGSGLGSTISVEAHGTIHSGVTSNNDGGTPGGIIAGYKPGGVATFSGAVNGDVIVDSDATITADAGYGIEAFTWGIGNVTVTTGATSSIAAAGTAIRASDHGGGDVSVTNEGSATGAVGLSVLATGAGNITIVNDGYLTGTSTTGISVTQNDENATGATYITNHGYVVGANGNAAIDIQENTSDTGIATIDNSGTIGPVAVGGVTSTTYAIVETGGAVTINNSGHINGNISVASATFDNMAAGTWTVSGTSAFGTLSKLDNAGEIDLYDGASVSGADGLAFDITNSGKVESWGTTSITGNIANTNSIEIHTGGMLSLFGSLSGSGSVTIDTGATLVVDAAVSQTVTFGGTGGKLDIDTTSFGGSIAGFASNETIDLSTIIYDGGTTAVYNSETRDLVVSDTHGHSIALELIGSYSDAHFVASSDGNGGTLIDLVPTDHWTSTAGGSWDTASNWSLGVPSASYDVKLDAPGTYTVDSTTSVTIDDLTVVSGVTLMTDPGTVFTVNGDAVDNGLIEAGPFSGNNISTIDIKGNVSGTGAIEISNKAVVEIEGAVSGTQVNGSFSGILVYYDNGQGTLILDHSKDFHGLISGSSTGAPLSSDNLIDMRDLAWTSSMSAQAQYDQATKITTVDFTNGATTITLSFLGKDLNWNLQSDGHGGTTVDDPLVDTPMTINSGAVLNLGEASAQDVTFANQTGTTGTFAIEHAADFTGVINGFAGDGTVANSDLLDLKDIDFSSLKGVSYTVNADQQGGTLTLTDGTGTATIKFAGSYTVDNFHFASDGYGGTLVIDPPTGPTFVGTSGQDQFAFTNSTLPVQSSIVDFEPGQDKIDLRDFANIHAFSDIVITQRADDALVTLDDRQSILLKNLVASSLHASDFIVATHA